MKYRDHRGGLAESMATERIVNSEEELLNHLNETHSRYPNKIEGYRFEYAGFDNRTKWDTYYVLIRLKGQDDYFVAGMSDSDKF